MDLTPYVENVKRCTAELKRRNVEATERARADLPRLVEAIQMDGRVRRAYLFGSLARKKDLFHPASDIDIAIEGLDWAGLGTLRERLQELTSFRVDVRDLNGTPEFRRVVEYYGELLHANP